MNAESLEPAVAGESRPEETESFVLKLYVAGQTPKSLLAIANLRKICEEHLKGRYEIQVIDLIEDPALARTNQILAIPTLVKSLPTPISRIIGDLSNESQVLMGLNVMRVRPGIRNRRILLSRQTVLASRLPEEDPDPAENEGIRSQGVEQRIGGNTLDVEMRGF